MSRQRFHEGREGGWRALAWAGAGAAGVLLLLVFSVGLIWLVGRSSTGAPALGAQPDSTPTPRALSFAQESPPPPAAATSTAPAVEPAADSTEPGLPAATPTPALVAMLSGDGSDPADDGDVFSAPDETDFAALASDSWSASADALRNDGSNADAEPWLKLAAAPGSAFAVEAEMRVNGLLDTFCDQSFGLAGGNPDAGQVYGGGLLFPCDGEAARARLTNVSIWEDGYHADPLIAEKSFDPGDDWRTYRFEVRGDRLRLIVDGVGIVSGPLDTALDSTGEMEAGLWVQGVDVEVRRIEVYPLPAS